MKIGKMAKKIKLYFFRIFCSQKKVVCELADLCANYGCWHKTEHEENNRCKNDCFAMDGKTAKVVVRCVEPKGGNKNA